MMTIKNWFSALVFCSGLTLTACSGGAAPEGGAVHTSEPASAPAAVSEPQTADGQVYRVAMNAEFPPFESQDAQGTISGFDVDLLNALAKEGGFEVSFKHQPWESLFNSLKNGDVDILASAVTITDERKQTMAFSEPYFQVSQVILVPEGKNVASAEDLKNLNRVGVVTGNTGDLAAGKILDPTSPKIARLDTLPLLLKELENGSLDAAVTDSSVVMEYIKNNGDKGFTMVEIPDFEVENYGLVVRIDDAETLEKLNRALAAIRANGEYDKIHERYFGKPAAAAPAQ